mmetsp:Transcript_58493/g.187906  ORF Transcript_58493/g.187906 Transcript_58493/m.187906 type:complete len:253 (+) Transcript_58493:891-1649(+)
MPLLVVRAGEGPEQGLSPVQQAPEQQPPVEGVTLCVQAVPLPQPVQGLAHAGQLANRSPCARPLAHEHGQGDARLRGLHARSRGGLDSRVDLGLRVGARALALPDTGTQHGLHKVADDAHAWLEYCGARARAGARDRGDRTQAHNVLSDCGGRCPDHLPQGLHDAQARALLQLHAGEAQDVWELQCQCCELRGCAESATAAGVILQHLLHWHGQLLQRQGSALLDTLLPDHEQGLEAMCLHWLRAAKGTHGA